MPQNHKAPAISVIMGVYYHSSDTHILMRSLVSILEQSYSNFEFIICDDGSSPAAQELISEYMQRDERICIVRNGGMINLPIKLNACLREAHGEYIARMDDDDYSHPDRFEKQLSFLEKNPSISFVGSNVNQYCAGEFVGDRKLPEYPEVSDFLFVQPFIHPTMMFRRNDIQSVGGYSEDKYCLLCEDYDLLLRLYERGFHGANLQEQLLDYSIPATAKGNRKMSDRWNETVTRYRRFQSLRMLPRVWPYVIKPLAVGLIPESILCILKKRTRL